MTNWLAPHIQIHSVDAHSRSVYEIQPLHDSRWAELVDRHPHSAVFHTGAWIEALHRTYGYEPIAYTTSPPGIGLKDGMVFCRVKSWISGRRLISLPFSDHCQPLVNDHSDERLLVDALERSLDQERFRYIEIRPKHSLAQATPVWNFAQSYFFHQIDLRPDLKTIFGRCHKSSTQRKILRAERERLTYEAGQSEALLDAFWNLFLITRRRHRILPQPKSWFRNLISCFGDALQIRVAFKEKQPVASILTLQHKNTLVYKYGCSDERLSNLGGTHLLFWSSIQEAKRKGLSVFDLGRSDCDNRGLNQFKERLGGACSTLTYVRLSRVRPSGVLSRNVAKCAEQIMGGVVPCLPNWILQTVGSAVYRHVA